MFAYEFLGTAFIMYALILCNGNFVLSSLGAAHSVTIVMMFIAYNVSGGHFNPAISVGMFLAQKKFGEDLLPLILMVVAQFAGAFFGILLGFFAVVDSEYQDKQVSDDNEKHANVPSGWVSFTAFLPKTGKGGSHYDDGLNC